MIYSRNTGLILLAFGGLWFGPADAGNAAAARPRTGRFEQEIAGFKTPVLAFVPKEYDPSKPYGLVVFLHGTGMTGAQMVEKTPIREFHEAGYILLAPTSNHARWGVGDTVPGPGPGAPRRDARKAELANLRRMIEFFQERYRIDPQCVHTVGFSIGTVILAHGIGFFDEWEGLKIRSFMGFSGGLTGPPVPAMKARAGETAVWVLNGADDRAHTAIFKTVHQAFKSAGYETRISEPRGLGHVFPLIPYEAMIDWWRELDGDRITHDTPGLALRRRRKQAVMVMREKRFPEAQQLLERLLAEHPRDAETLYNLACLYSLTGKPERAIPYLGQAIECGFRNLKHIYADADLAALRELDAFDRLIERFQKRRILPRTDRPAPGGG